MQDLFGERTEYKGDHLLESQVPSDPFVLFDTWLADAFAAKEAGLLPEPTAMVIATCVDDQPSARTVLLKNVSDQGFIFFTNYNSRKGSELSRNRKVALLFGWYPLHRQVRAEGSRRPILQPDLANRSWVPGLLSNPRPFPLLTSWPGRTRRLSVASAGPPCHAPSTGAATA
jgi:pyridoxine/pyridoxamine 5'-phosphate oxidase